MTKLSKIAALALASSMALGVSAPAQASADPLIGEMMTVGFNFCPRGWSEAAGQLLPISSNTALFSLLGTTYGGDGRTTFALPDLRGRSVVGMNTGAGLTNIRWGEKSGRDTITLTTLNMPAHSHTAQMGAVSGTPGDKAQPSGRLLSSSAALQYSDQAANAALNSSAITVANSGNGQAFNSRNPYLGMLNCIAMVGQYPSRS